jgi:thymidylate synthase
MRSFTGNNVNDVYADIINAIATEGEKVSPRGTTTLELHPAMIEIAHPRERIVTAFGRPLNIAFANAEVLWILAGRDDVAMLEFYNSTIGQFSDDGVTFNAPYGDRLIYAHGLNQLVDAAEVLKRDPDTRQCIIQIWKATQDLPIVNGDENNTKDRACNVLAHVMIRRGALDWLQIVRSNDAILGTPYNFIQWTTVQEYLAALVGVPVGRYFHLADSLHVYLDTYYDERNHAVSTFDIYEHLGNTHAPMGGEPINLILSTERQIRDYDLTTLSHLQSKVSPYWFNLLSSLLAHAYYKAGDDIMALRTLLAQGDAVMAAAQARFYWTMRWHKLENKNGLRTGINRAWPNPVVRWIEGVQ